MDSSHISALSALAGSAIGGLASIAATWLTQHGQGRAQRQVEAIAHRQQLYEDFIDEASRSFADALTHDLQDPARIVGLYALVGKLRLFATTRIVAEADKVMHAILATYHAPIEIFATRKIGRTPISMCSAPSRKSAAKTCAPDLSRDAPTTRFCAA
jgi:hypothetical protein